MMGKIADKIESMTEEKWLSCNEANRKIIEKYLNNATHLSDKSAKQYESALKIFAYWIKENLDNKEIYNIKSREYADYQNWLYRNGVAKSTIQLKRSAVSNLNNFIMVYYEEEYPKFRNYINKSIKIPETGEVHKKEPLNPEEYLLLCDTLEKNKKWQHLAYVKFTYISGCRREESRLLLKDVVNAKEIIKTVKIKDSEGNQTECEVRKYKTHDIRCKGKSNVGNVRPLEFSEEVMDALKKWLEIRGEDNCPYMFVAYTKGIPHQVAPTTFNYWCSHGFTDIVGRRVHPHLFRESRATNLVVHSGKDIEVARKLLGHKSSETTRIYIIQEDSEDADEAFID